MAGRSHRSNSGRAVTPTPRARTDFSVDQHRESDLAVISLQGSLTTETTDRLSACLDTTVPTTRSLVVDLSRTTALDEEGLSVRLDAGRRARRRGGAVRAAGVHGAVEDVFEEFDAWHSLGGRHSPDGGATSPRPRRGP
ncbi:STAS domain-containing protein [Kineococcus sp. NBC_00420]|uniref:STAS domain-containing protein n=1 Tax=Kineococcus sp. NBC_00420 TaxID=2903564 RepID=UPI002E1D6021